MPFRQITVAVPHRFRDGIVDLVMRFGSLGTIEHSEGITAYFSGDREISDIIREIDVVIALIRHASSGITASYAVSLLPDTDWNESWKRSFTPVTAGDRFIVLPPWERTSGPRLPIIIDPGMAFGTGHHGTTRSCLALIERWSCRVAHDRFLDLGTGTGILAIAASKLGFRQVEGIDTDPLAVEAAQANCVLNGAGSVHIQHGDLSSARGMYDMIAANLLSEALIRSAGTLAERLAAGGCTILSGILLDQRYDVLDAVRNAGMRIDETMEEGNWVSLVATMEEKVRRSPHAHHACP